MERKDIPRNLTSPQGEAVGVPVAELMANGRDMVNQAQFLGAVTLRVGRRVDIQTRDWKHARLLPVVDDCLYFRAPHQIRRAIGTSVLDRNVVVGAPNLVLGTVLALREVLITSDVPLLASFTTFARLGVAKLGTQSAHEPKSTNQI